MKLQDKIKIKQAKFLKPLYAFRASSFPQIFKPCYKEIRLLSTENPGQNKKSMKTKRPMYYS